MTPVALVGGGGAGRDLRSCARYSRRIPSEPSEYAFLDEGEAGHCNDGGDHESLPNGTVGCSFHR